MPLAMPRDMQLTLAGQLGHGPGRPGARGDSNSLFHIVICFTFSTSLSISHFHFQSRWNAMNCSDHEQQRQRTRASKWARAAGAGKHLPKYVQIHTNTGIYLRYVCDTYMSVYDTDISVYDTDMSVSFTYRDVFCTYMCTYPARICTYCFAFTWKYII
jgi:hypothetical protein